MKKKHPQDKTANTHYVTEVSEDTMPYHPSIFEQINAKTVRKSTLKTHGSHGPPGLDACEWRRTLTHFNQTSIEFCKTITKLSFTIATKVLLHENLTAYNSYRLIPLDKNPGEQPLLKMTLDLTSRQTDSGEADPAEPFSMQVFSTPMLNPASKLYLTPTNIMRVSKH